MSFAFEIDESVADGLRRIASEQIDKAVRSIDDESDRHVAVHEVRKRCKKVRALARIVRGVLDDYDEVNAHFRDCARLLSEVRDATANLETVDAVVARRRRVLDAEAIAELRSRLVERRERLAKDLDLDVLLAGARQRLREGRAKLDRPRLDESGFDALADGVAKTYSRARKRAMRTETGLPSEHFHEWRKRVKYHRYHCDLLRRTRPTMLEARERACHDLTDVLGEDHDLVVLRRRLHEMDLADELRDVVVVLDALGVRRSERLREQGRRQGRRLFVDDEEVLLMRLETWWKASRASSASVP